MELCATVPQHGGLEPPEPGFVELARARSAVGLKDTSLVLASQGIPHEVVQAAGELLLVVPSAHAERAREQLRRYERENRYFRPGGAPIELLTDGVVSTLVYALVLMLVFGLERSRALGFDWWEAGISDSRELGGGEVWRALTSLTLHADMEHLLGNVVFGGLFGLLVVQLVGNGVGWLTVLLSGFAGNLINAAAQPQVHRSIGASTAVFGALAILVGYEVVRRKRAQLGFVRRWAPLLFGSFLLAWLGFGGEDGPGNTDVMAHVFGFLAGLVLGGLVAVVDRRGGLDRPRLQTVCAALAVLLLVVSWALALAY